MKTFIVEHLDPELEAWSALEYLSIATETHANGSTFLLTSVPDALVLPPNLKSVEGTLFRAEGKGVEELFPQKERVCLLDPAAASELTPADAEKFDVFLFGGILGDDPPRDRTSELRKKGYPNRRLGPVQMTTDTAVRVTRIIIQDQTSLDDIPYVDNPEIKINRNESTEMPFRYVKNDKGGPIMPEGMLDLIKADAEKSLDDLL